MRAVMTGEALEGMRLLQEALAHCEVLGDQWNVGFAFACIGFADAVTGDAAAAVTHFTAGVRALEAAGDRHYAGVIHSFLGGAALNHGDLSGALAHIQTGVTTSVAFQDRWLLSMATQATAALVWAHAQPEQQARLLGAADALMIATGTQAQWETNPGGRDIAAQHEQLVRGEGEGAAAYREGRTLRFDEIAALGLHLLEEVAQSLARSEGAEQMAKAAQEPAARHTNENPLTAREVEVLRLVAQGLSSKAIGRQLFISQSTVNYHLTAVFNKLAVDTRAQAVAVAAQRGLL